jgi:cobalt-zinc-cadmium efflux system outer membrane protein
MPSPFPWRRAFLGVAAIALAAFASAASAEPVTLAQALERAQAGSPVISAAEANVRAAEGRAKQAGLRPNPEVSVEVENFTGSGPYAGFESSESTFALEQRLELGGKRNARVTVARAEIEAARLRLSVARADVAKDVRGAYADALAAEDRALLARQAVERAEDLARVVTALVDAGREPPLRALRAQAAVEEARAKAQAADAEAASARRALATLVGVGDEDLVLLRDAEPAMAPSDLIDPTESVDVKLADAEAVVARETVKRERTGSAPDVTLQAGIRRFEDSGDQAVIFGFSAPIPIIDRNQGNVAAARAEADAADARRRLALAESVRRTRDAQAALRASEARLAVLETRIVPQAEEALRLARLGYEAGKFPLLEVIDAQDALATAREDLIAARLDRARAIAALIRAAAR